MLVAFLTSDRPPLVVVAAVAPAKADAELSLPATARAVESTVLYAKTTGFIGTVRVDLGSRVKAGDLLATIEVPERDDELRHHVSRPNSKTGSHANLGSIHAV